MKVSYVSQVVHIIFPNSIEYVVAVFTNTKTIYRFFAVLSAIVLNNWIWDSRILFLILDIPYPDSICIWVREDAAHIATDLETARLSAACLA